MRAFSVVVQLVPGFSFEFVQLYIPLCFCCFAIFFFLEFSFKLSLKKGSKQIDHTDHYAREKRFGNFTRFILKQYSSLSRYIYNGEVSVSKSHYLCIQRIWVFLLFPDTFRIQRIWSFLLFIETFRIQDIWSFLLFIDTFRI